MNYAIKSGITITASYAIQQSTRLLKVTKLLLLESRRLLTHQLQTVEGNQREELQDLQERLHSKIRVCLLTLYLKTQQRVQHPSLLVLQYHQSEHQIFRELYSRIYIWF